MNVAVPFEFKTEGGFRQNAMGGTPSILSTPHPGRPAALFGL